jgi:hypothetical protein
MKIRIIAPGIYGVDGEIPVGTELTIGDDPPAGWAGKYEVVRDDPKPAAKPVTNPAKTKPAAKE